MRIARKQRIVAQGKLSCLSDVSVRCWMFFVPRGRISGWKFRVKWWIHLSKHEKNNGFRIYSISNFFLCSSSHSFKLWTFFSLFCTFSLLTSRCSGFSTFNWLSFAKKSSIVYFVRIHIQKCRKKQFLLFSSALELFPLFQQCSTNNERKFHVYSLLLQPNPIRMQNFELLLQSFEECQKGRRKKSKKVTCKASTTISSSL